MTGDTPTTDADEPRRNADRGRSGKGVERLIACTILNFTAERLRGAKIATATFPPGSIQDTILKRWLLENGLDPEKDVDIVAMGPGDAVTAMGAGAVDAAFLPQPYPAIIELEGSGVMVVPSGKMWPNHACCCLLVS